MCIRTFCIEKSVVKQATSTLLSSSIGGLTAPALYFNNASSKFSGVIHSPLSSSFSSSSSLSSTAVDSSSSVTFFCNLLSIIYYN